MTEKIPTLVAGTIMQKFALSAMTKDDITKHLSKLSGIRHIEIEEQLDKAAEVAKALLTEQFPELWAVVKDTTEDTVEAVANRVISEFPTEIEVELPRGN